MMCDNCGRECADGNIFCEHCGASLEGPVLPENVDEKGRVKKQPKPKKVKAPKEAKPKKEKKVRTEEEKEAFRKKAKLCCTLAVIAVIIIVIVKLVSAAGAAKGYNAFQKIPLGRTVDYAESETKLEFNDHSTNHMINKMSDFDYIVVCDKTVKVSGVELPKWAIMVTVGEDDIIVQAEYYDFTQLKLNWKGRKTDEKLDQDDLEYGIKIKEINKNLGMKPYYIKRSVTNDSVYCYRYYYTNSSTGADEVYNYYVEFSDVENTVRNIHFSEINYGAVILNANSGSPIFEEEPKTEDSDSDGSDDEDDESSDEDSSDEDDE